MHSTETVREAGLWKRGVLWLLFLGPFFFLSYSFANWVSGQRSDVGVIVFAWESYIPLLPWTIIPYWSIDLLYGLSFLLPKTRREMDRHALRLLTVQIICVACFLLWPLTISFVRPELSGVFGGMFDVLMGFDKPFNQAPSLHIALLVVLWTRYAVYTPPRWQPLLHLWFALIAVSVLTTWQHHFIDLPTGALVGFFCLWLWPTTGASPFSRAQLTTDPQRRRLALYYLLGASLLTALGVVIGGTALWLLWPALSLAMVGLNYLLLGAQGFQKRANGQLSIGALGLFAPYVLAAWINSRWWTRRAPQPVLVTDDVWLGRLPTNAHASAAVAWLDMCAELPVAAGAKPYRNFPVLDLSVPSTSLCRAAGQALEELRQQGPVLVFCALGYSRSATAVAAWLLLTKRCATPVEALEYLRQARPGVVLTAAHLAVLQPLCKASEVSDAGL